MSGDAISQHPVDRLIRELIHPGRAATPEENAGIVDRIATAPFNPAAVAVRAEHRGLTHLGRRLGERADSATYHLIQRVAADRQWSTDTSMSQYLVDLRRGVLAVSARVAVYRRRGGYLAATVTPTGDALPPSRRGVGAQPFLLVVYSADRSIIVTGYQFSELRRTGVPEDARWLK